MISGFTFRWSISTPQALHTKCVCDTIFNIYYFMYVNNQIELSMEAKATNERNIQNETLLNTTK